MKSCHACKKELSDDRKTGRRDECPGCHADLHCCLNCAHHDKTASRQCREPSAEQVKDKGKANFCDYFFFISGATPPAPPDAAEQARRSLADLFTRGKAPE